MSLKRTLYYSKTLKFSTVKMEKGGGVKVMKCRGGGAATQGLEFKMRD